ncbi:hypothetical protein Tco_0784581 [Tanacetum coccineum]
MKNFRKLTRKEAKVFERILSKSKNFNSRNLRFEGSSIKRRVLSTLISSNGTCKLASAKHFFRFLSLMIEKLIGENYNNNDLTLLKPYTISAASFKKPLAYEVVLTSYMLKVAKLLNEPEKSLILPYVEVNVDDVVDKSLSETNVQPFTQPKAKTNKKSRKKKSQKSSVQSPT